MDTSGCHSSVVARRRCTQDVSEKTKQEEDWKTQVREPCEMRHAQAPKTQASKKCDEAQAGPGISTRLGQGKVRSSRP